MKLAVIVVISSASIFITCDDNESSVIDHNPTASANHTVSAIVQGTQPENTIAISFSYEQDILTSIASIQFGIREFKYDNQRLQQITNSNYPYYTVSFDYNADGSVVNVTWAGVGRSNGRDTFKHTNGKLDSIISIWRWPTEMSVSKSKVHWNGDNIESMITHYECMCGGPIPPLLSIDTVTYQYGDGLNPFSSSKYAGYTESLGARDKIPFASKNILVRFNQVSTSYRYDSDHVLVEERRGSNSRELTYVLDNENYPVEIREEVTSDNGDKSERKSEIRY